MPTELQRLLAVARGDEPADLLLRNARVVNVFTGEIVHADVAVAGTRVAGVGRHYTAERVVDLNGLHVAPGFIDAHVHIESAMLPPGSFAAVVLPRGVTAVVTDPHEIANVAGIDGIRFMLEHGDAASLQVWVNAPSCVPATDLATSGAELAASDLAGLRGLPNLLGLAEVMDFPGVIAGRSDVLDKLLAFHGRPVDGHAPGLEGKRLDAYAAAGIGSDHECTTLEEARDKLRAGMTVFVREGSAARDLRALLPLVEPSNQHRFCFCTDDRTVCDLIEEGSVDHAVRQAIVNGLDPLTAIRMATINVATHFGLADRGAVAPGRVADLVVFEDLQAPHAQSVYAAGRLVARDGCMLEAVPSVSGRFGTSVHIDWESTRFEIPAGGRDVRVIGVVPGTLITESLIEPCRIEGDLVVADPERDRAKLAVVERHTASGRVGLGFAKGLGLPRGAIAGTVAHDHHNLVVAGADDRSMLTAARAVADAGGGLAAAEQDEVLAVLPLPICGLMSDAPPPRVARGLRDVITAAHRLGSGLDDPFMVMSFLALEVIPSLKLTDRGLVDVERMRIVPLFP